MLTNKERRRTTSAVLAAGAVSLATLTHAMSPAAARAAELTRLSVGHVDAIDVAYESGSFELSVHDETVEPDVERDPASVVLVAKPESRLTVPDDPAYRFLGAPGADVWILPEVQDPNLLFAGLSAEEVQPGVFTDDSVRVHFVRFSGPNGVSLFQSGSTGAPVVAVDSEESGGDVVTLAAGSHAHYNWAFEQSGTYRLTYVVSGRLAATGKVVTSARTTIAFEVQP